MKVVMPVAIPELMRFRELTGADRFDEMWEGVLSGASFVLVPPSADGWTLLAPVGVELRAGSTDSGSSLHLRLRGRPETERAI